MIAAYLNELKQILLDFFVAHVLVKAADGKGAHAHVRMHAAEELDGRRRLDWRPAGEQRVDGEHVARLVRPAHGVEQTRQRVSVVEAVVAATPQHVLLLLAELGKRVLAQYARQQRVVVLERVAHVETLVVVVVVVCICIYIHYST